MTDVGRIEFGSTPPGEPKRDLPMRLTSLARADEIMHRECREKIVALEAELAAWREVGAILDSGNFYCMVCGGGTSRTKEGHRSGCKLAALLGGK